MIKNYIQFNEGIKHLLKGPTEEEIIKKIKSNPTQLLIKSCEIGNLNLIKYAIEQGGDINFKNNYPLRVTSELFNNVEICSSNIDFAKIISLVLIKSSLISLPLFKITLSILTSSITSVINVGLTVYVKLPVLS